MPRMFVGHYAAAFAAKSLDRRVPLWALFLAAQFLDLLWGPFILLGIEKAKVDPTINATLPLDLYYMPYSHSLVAAVSWSILVAVGAAVIWTGSERWRAALAIGGAILSHWFLDLIVHSPDLPLYGNQFKIGFAVWNHVAIAFCLETLLLFLGIEMYVSATNALKRAAFGYGVVLVVVHYVAMFVIKPPSLAAAAVMFMSLYLALALGAWWVGRSETQSPRPATRSAAVSL